MHSMKPCQQLQLRAILIVKHLVFHCVPVNLHIFTGNTQADTGTVSLDLPVQFYVILQNNFSTI